MNDLSFFIRSGNLSEIKKFITRESVIKSGDLITLVTKKKCVKTLIFLKDYTDLTTGGGILLFQAIYARQFDNATYILSLIPDNSPVFMLCLRNIFTDDYWSTRQSATLEAVALALCKRLDSYQAVASYALERPEDFERIYMQSRIDQTHKSAIHKI